MTALKVEIDPSDVGIDAGRLERIAPFFERYVDEGRLPGWHIVATRRGQVVYSHTYGQRDLDAQLPWEDDTIVRIFSMTKPITSVAAMMLYEEGGFQLKDPVHKFIPEFADTRVYRSGSFLNPMTEPQVTPMQVWHLLTHTSGLTYGFHNTQAVDAMYRKAGFAWGTPPGVDLEESCRRWAELPLVFQPGSGWNYGVSTDVLGRVVEVVSGMALDELFRTRIFEPLGMNDTDFWVDESRQSRLARLYMPDPSSKQAVPTPGPEPVKKPTMLGGGGGLCGTAPDYLRFCHMLLNGGELDGVRLLGNRTVDYMTRNHLPEGSTSSSSASRRSRRPCSKVWVSGWASRLTSTRVANKTLSSDGEFAWGGAASTAFWVDPSEDLCVVFLTQLIPSSTYPIRAQLKQLLYQALVD